MAGGDAGAGRDADAGADVGAGWPEGAVGPEGAVEDADDSSGSPREAAMAATATSRPVTRNPEKRYGVVLRRWRLVMRSSQATGPLPKRIGISICMR